MKRLSHLFPTLVSTTLRSARLGALFLFVLFVIGVPKPSAALPIATGSKCKSSWVNNEDAMACFIQGEDEQRNGAKHPHYVGCFANGDIMCCTDDDHGNQTCDNVGTTAAEQSIQDLHVRAILDAQQTNFTLLERISHRLEKLENRLRQLEGKSGNSPRTSKPHKAVTELDESGGPEQQQ